MKKPTLVLIILGVFIFVSILILAYLNYFSSLKTPADTTVKNEISIISTETITQTTPTAAVSSFPSSWKTYTGQDFTYPNNIYSGYSFNYPDTCTLKSETFTCTLKNSVATLQINAGGHGGGEGTYRVLIDNETKIIDTVEGKLTAIEDIDNKMVFGTYWINKTPKLTQEPIFGFEFSQISSTDFDEFKKLFDEIIFTFKFI